MISASIPVNERGLGIEVEENRRSVKADVTPSEVTPEMTSSPDQVPAELSGQTVQPNPLDATLLEALREPKSRMFLLLLEKKLLKWIDSSIHSLELEPMNGYLRLLSHKIAEYYRVNHTSNTDGSAVVWYKPISGLPDIWPARLADIDIQTRPSSASPPSTPTTRPKIMTKKPALLKKTAATTDTYPASASAAASSNNSPTISEAGGPNPSIPCTPNTGINTEISSAPPTEPTNIETTPAADPNATTQTDSSIIPNNDSEYSRQSTANTSASVIPPKGLGSFEARAAAYEEARARIFKDFTEQDIGTLDDTDQKEILAQLEAMHDPDYVKGPLMPTGWPSHVSVPPISFVLPPPPPPSPPRPPLPHTVPHMPINNGQQAMILPYGPSPPVMIANAFPARQPFSAPLPLTPNGNRPCSAPPSETSMMAIPLGVSSPYISGVPGSGPSHSPVPFRGPPPNALVQYGVPPQIPSGQKNNSKQDMQPTRFKFKGQSFVPRKLESTH